MAALLRASAELREQPRLADPGFADQRERTRPTSLEVIEDPF
jgi:hypothetical protein